MVNAARSQSARTRENADDCTPSTALPRARGDPDRRLRLAIKALWQLKNLCSVCQWYVCHKLDPRVRGDERRTGCYVLGTTALALRAESNIASTVATAAAASAAV